MRLHYLHYGAVPSEAANAVHVMRMCGAFGRAGHKVELLCRDPGTAATDTEIFEAYGVPAGAFGLHRLDPGMRWSDPLRALAGMAPAGLTSTPHRFGWRVAAAGRGLPIPELYYGRHPRALLAVASEGRPLVYESHQPPHSAARWRLERQLVESLAFRRLVVICEALRDEYLRRFPELPPEQVIVAHDAADPAPPAAPREPWPGRWQAPQVGYVGSLLPGKGAEQAAALAPLLPQVDFHIIGGEPSLVAALRATYAAPNLHFHGHLAHAELASCYARLEVLLAPLQPRILTPRGRDIGRWTSPLKLFEYMAQGRPILASKTPAVSAILDHDRTAWLVPWDDLAAWREALTALLDDPERRQRLGRQARERFLERHTWDARARQVLSGLP